jgi:hypothetical protein
VYLQLSEHVQRVKRRERGRGGESGVQEVFSQAETHRWNSGERSPADAMIRDGARARMRVTGRVRMSGQVRAVESVQGVLAHFWKPS